MTPYRENIGPLCALDYDAILKFLNYFYLELITNILYNNINNSFHNELLA